MSTHEYRVPFLIIAEQTSFSPTIGFSEMAVRLFPELAAFVMVLIIASRAFPQELHEWRSKSGKSLRAAYSELDEIGRSVTVLVPKTLSFDLLDERSLRNERELATREQKRELEELTAIRSLESEGRRFLRIKLRQLQEMQMRSDFRKHGFSKNGQHYHWLDELMPTMSQRTFRSADFDEAAGCLLKAAVELVSNAGEESAEYRALISCVSEYCNGGGISDKDAVVEAETSTDSPSDTQGASMESDDKMNPEQLEELNEIRRLPANQSALRTSLYLKRFEPELLARATKAQDRWDVGLEAGDVGAMKRAHSELRELLGQDLLGFYWDVDDIMRDPVKIQKILREMQEYGRRNNRR